MEVERQRGGAGATLAGRGPVEAAESRARKAENDQSIAWFVAMLNYRFESYDYALDHLLVETPAPQSVTVDYELTRLSHYVARANAHDFCAGATWRHAEHGASIPSRFATQAVDNEVIAIK
jgi:hypothetical protein